MPHAVTLHVANFASPPKAYLVNQALLHIATPRLLLHIADLTSHPVPCLTLRTLSPSPSFAQQPFPYLTPHTLPHITFLASHAKPCFSPHALPPTPSLTPHYVPCLATLALPHTPNLTYPKTLPHTNPITFPPQKSLTHARPPAEVL